MLNEHKKTENHKFGISIYVPAVHGAMSSKVLEEMETVSSGKRRPATKKVRITDAHQAGKAGRQSAWRLIVVTIATNPATLSTIEATFDDSDDQMGVLLPDERCRAQEPARHSKHRTMHIKSTPTETLPITSSQPFESLRSSTVA